MSQQKYIVMKALKIILAVAAAAALLIFANSCNKDNDGVKITYAITSFSFDNNKPADATALRNELDSYLKGCVGVEKSVVKKGVQERIDKYAVKPFSYSITVSVLKNGKENGFIMFKESIK